MVNLFVAPLEPGHPLPQAIDVVPGQFPAVVVFSNYPALAIDIVSGYRIGPYPVAT